MHCFVIVSIFQVLVQLTTRRKMTVIRAKHQNHIKNLKEFCNF